MLRNKYNNKKPPFGGFIYYFFFFAVVFFAGAFFTVAVFLAPIALYSLYSASTQVYASNAEAAVISPAINPSENIANSKMAMASITVYPIFFDRTFMIFSNIFSLLFVWMQIL